MILLRSVRGFGGSESGEGDKVSRVGIASFEFSTDYNELTKRKFVHRFA